MARKKTAKKKIKKKINPIFAAYDKGWKVVNIPTNDPNLKGRNFKLTEETIDLKSRLDECMTRLETAVAEAISKLKENI